MMCDCGNVYCQQCCAEPDDNMVPILWMPRWLRQQHRNAGSTAISESNGAMLLNCTQECADRILEDEGPWAEEA